MSEVGSPISRPVKQAGGDYAPGTSMHSHQCHECGIAYVGSYDRVYCSLKCRVLGIAKGAEERRSAKREAPQAEAHSSLAENRIVLVAAEHYAAIRNGEVIGIVEKDRSAPSSGLWCFGSFSGEVVGPVVLPIALNAALIHGQST